MSLGLQYIGYIKYYALRTVKEKLLCQFPCEASYYRVTQGNTLSLYVSLFNVLLFQRYMLDTSENLIEIAFAIHKGITLRLKQLK